MRLALLKSKLPDEVISMIMLYDSHLTADLIKNVEFTPVAPTELTSACLLLTVEKPVHFIPALREFRRRLYHNKTRHLHDGVWLPIFFRYRSWRLVFDRWRYETMSDIDYLPTWVVEQYLEQSDKNHSGLGAE